MTATVETVTEQLDLAPIIPAEKVVAAVARAVTLTDTDVATAKVQVAKATLVGEDDEPIEPGADEDLDDFWHTSEGKFRFTLQELPFHLQFIHQLLKELPCNQEADILYYMLRCLNLLVLHGDALSKAAKDHRGFLIWCQENLTIRNLWDLCNAEHSHICAVCVPLLLHCVNLPSGSDVFWNVIQEEFHQSDWRVRFVAAERVTMLARFMDSAPLRAHPALQAALASAFCYLVACMDDMNVHVAQRATLYLGTIHDTAIRSLLMCLETQFDSVVVDRPVVLQTLYQLHNCMSDRRILSWEFFLGRFDALFLEAQLALERSGDLSGARDLRNSEVGSEVLARKLSRAHEALAQRGAEGSSATTPSGGRTLSASFGPKWPYKRTMSAPAAVASRPDVRPDGHIHSLTATDDRHFVNFITKIIDLEEGDQETMHLLVFLFMQFLSRADQAFPSEEKMMAKTQTIVLRHLYLLLGYNQTERTFFIPAPRMRASPVFCAFLSTLPQLLDQNHAMGGSMMGPSLAILRACPCPQGTPLPEPPCVPPAYSLWHLEPHARRSWLMALIVLLYKYQYSAPPLGSQLQGLLRIVLNSLDAQRHRCRRIPATLQVAGACVGASARSRDVSQPSLGGGDGAETVEMSGSFEAATAIATSVDSFKDSPPLSPRLSVAADGSAAAESLEAAARWRSHEQRSLVSPRATAGNGSETDLAAIPESPKSESTLQGSVHGSFEEVMSVEESTLLPTATEVESTGKLSHAKEVAVEHDNQKPTWYIGSEVENNKSPNGSHKTGSDEEKMTVTSPAVLSSVQVSQVVTHTAPYPKLQSVAARRWVEGTRSSLEAALAAPPGSGSSSTPTPTPAPSPAPSPAASSPAPSPVASPDGARWTPGGRERLLPVGRARPPPAPWPLGEGDFGSPATEEASSGSASQPELAQLAPSAPPPELPAPERLLPVGARDSLATAPLMSPSAVTITPAAASVVHVLERVKQALGIAEICSLEIHVAPEEGEPVRESHSLVRADRPEHLRGPLAPAELPSGPVSMATTPSGLGTTPSLRGVSPRKLTKQVALESPPPTLTSAPTDDEHPTFYRGVHCDKRPHTAARAEEPARAQRSQQASRRAGVFSMGRRAAAAPRRPGSWSGPPTEPTLDESTQQACHAELDLKQSFYRVGDECVFERCSECGAPREQYSDEELGLCIIALGTFIHREPAHAAPLLPDILNAVSGLAQHASFPWQSEGGMFLPGGATSVAHQFLRCVLHQLAPNGIFTQMFQTQAEESARMQFFRSVARALLDFAELTPLAPLHALLEALGAQRAALPADALPRVLRNAAAYLDCLPLQAEGGVSGGVCGGVGPPQAAWQALLQLLDAFLRRLLLLLPALPDPHPLLRVLVSVLRVPGVSACKGILDPISKIMCYAIENHTLKANYIVDLCYLCNRGFTRDREKLILTRMVVFELVQVMKFKTAIPDSNFIMLVTIVLQDAGGALPPLPAVHEAPGRLPEIAAYSTCAADCMRHHLADVLDFLADFHTLSKIKSYSKGMTAGLNEDTLGGVLKGGIAQYVALEMSRGNNNNKDNRTVSRYLPWLYTAPSTLAQGPREFIECVGHLRLLSWLLLGALTHTALMGSRGHGGISPCQPVPQDASCYIADYVQVILAGFAEQSKASVLHMSSMFHAFILCQLWTVYLEQCASYNMPTTESHMTTMTILLDFWGKITPCILNLVSHSKVLAETVNLHFLSLLEALLECNSTVLGKLLPLWSPVLFTHHIQLPGHLQVRLQNCRNFPPTNFYKQPASQSSEQQQQQQQQLPQNSQNAILLRWLQRLQFKMGQIEMQSSAATQFYSV